MARFEEVKKHFKKGVLMAFLALLGFFNGVQPVFSASPFTDDFESYTTGALSGQDSWEGLSGCLAGEVVDTGCPEGNKCDYLENKNNNKCQYFHHFGGTDLTTGTLSFQTEFLNYTTPAEYGFYRFVIGGAINSQTFWLYNQSGNTTWRLYNSTIGMDLVTGIAVAGVHTIVIDWADGQIRAKVDDGEFSEWYSMGSSEGIGSDFLVGGGQYVDFILDDFSTGETPPIEGTYPIITPTNPPDGENTTVDFDNFDLQGNISIPTASTYVWQKLYIYFKKTDGIETTSTEITLPDLTGGESYDYSATSTIAGAFSTDVYAVSYQAWGYWCDPLYPEYCGKVGLSYPYDPPGTYISEGTSPTSGGIPLVVVDQWQPPTLENCDDPAYNFLEKTTCKIQNSLLGLVIPSADSVNKLFGTFQQFQNRFPFSYVRSIFETLDNIKTGLNESATISIKVFGQSGNVSLAFWQTTVTIGGIETTIGATLKLILTFFLYIGFLIWGIGYLHRLL